MRHITIGLLGVAMLAGSVSGCASNASFVANLDNAPSWFLQQVQGADKQGYPMMAETPPAPTDVPKLSWFDAQLQTVSEQGQAVAAEPRASRVGMLNVEAIQAFADAAYQYTDVQKFNQEQAAAEQEQNKED